MKESTKNQRSKRWVFEIFKKIEINFFTKTSLFKI